MSDSQIPPSWIKCRFDEIAKVVSGRNQKEVENPSGSFAIYGSGGSFGRADEYLCEANTTVIGRKGTINSPIFVTERFWNVDTAFGLYPFNVEMLLPKFLHYFCRSFNFSALDKSTTIPSLAKRDIEGISVTLAPLNEQKRIVAKIEELFSELEAGEESFRQARRQLGVYRQSLLKQAFEGKLTATWRKQNPHLLESSDELLQRIQAERKERYKEQLEEWESATELWIETGKKSKRPAKPRKPKQVPLPAPELICDLTKLPAPWLWLPVSANAVQISDGPFGTNLKTSDYVGSGVRVIRLENISTGKFIEEKESFITLKKYETLRRYTVLPGDIVLASFINDEVRATLVPPSIKYAVNKADCIRVHCYGESVLAEFLVLSFAARYFYQQLEKEVHGVGRPRINTTQLGEALVPLCSLPEQQEIVRLLDEQFTVIQQNEREIDAALKRSEALRQSILKKAFSGHRVFLQHESSPLYEPHFCTSQGDPGSELFRPPVIWEDE